MLQKYYISRASDYKHSFDILEIENEFNLNDDNFRSELNYDGYLCIEDYDNSVYNSCRMSNLGAIPLDMGTLE